MIEPGSWSVIVVRSWTEHGALRVRLLHATGGDEPDQVVVASVDAAAATVTEWLRALTGREPHPSHDGSGTSR